jgi:hypothetical protein
MESGAAGPTSSSLVQAFHFYRRPIGYFAECARRYGDNFTIRIPTFPAPITFISDPEAIREIFAAYGTDLLETESFLRTKAAGRDRVRRSRACSLSGFFRFGDSYADVARAILPKQAFPLSL